MSFDARGAQMGNTLFICTFDNVEPSPTPENIFLVNILRSYEPIYPEWSMYQTTSPVEAECEIKKNVFIYVFILLNTAII